MRVVIHSILKLKEALGGGDIGVDLPERTTIGGLLELMYDRWGEKLAPHLFDPGSRLPVPGVRIMVNGQTIRFLNGMQTVLKEGDDVLLLPLVTGG